MKLRSIVFALTAAAVAAPSIAAPIVNATRVRIVNANGDWLQVAEVQAFTFGGTNVAAAANGGLATGTTPGYDPYATPDKAIDGNVGGNYYTDTIFHPNVAGVGPFLDITFNAATLAGLSVFGRTDGPWGLERDLYTVTVFNAAGQQLFSGNLDARNSSHVASVLFDPVAAVPEPGTWAMMLMGFGLIGGALRTARRRTRVTFANA